MSRSNPLPWWRLLPGAALLALAGCATPPEPAGESPGAAGPGGAELGTVDDLLNRAESRPSPQAENLYLQAARLLADMGRTRDAARVLAVIDTASLAPQQAMEVILLGASLSLDASRPAEALRQLADDLPLPLEQLDDALRTRVMLLRARAYDAAGRQLDNARERIAVDRLLNPEERRRNHEAIWNALTALPAARLEGLVAEATAFELRGWYELGLLGKAYQNNLDRQLVELERWQQAWTRHPAALQLPQGLQMLQMLAAERPAAVALLLPLGTTAGQVIRDGFMAAYYDVRDIGGQVPVIRLYDTTGLDDIMPLHRRAVAEGAALVIGPLQKPLVAQLHEEADLQVPTLALNNVEGQRPRSEQLYQFALSPENEARQVAQRAWNDGYRYAAVLSPEDELGSGYNAPRKRESFLRSWREMGGTIVARETFRDDYTTAIESLLDLDQSEYRRDQLAELLGENLQFTPRRRHDIGFIVLIAQPGAARQIKPSLAYLYAGDIPVYATQDVYSGVARPLVDGDLNGITFGESPWLLGTGSGLRGTAQSLFPQSNALYWRLQAFGVDAFRLYPRLRQLDSVENSQIFGATGLLRMDENRNIRQQLDWARFEEGLAQPVSR